MIKVGGKTPNVFFIQNDKLARLLVVIVLHQPATKYHIAIHSESFSGMEERIRRLKVTKIHGLR